MIAVVVGYRRSMRDFLVVDHGKLGCMRWDERETPSLGFAQYS